MSKLRLLVPMFMPVAISWAEGNARLILESGEPLSDPMIEIARSVGVENPEYVRLLEVESIPSPTEPMLALAATKLGLVGPEMLGLTLGYGIFVKTGHKTRRLLSHELRHVAQYEQAGSIANFLPRYIHQILDHGYANAPLELDARACELA